MSANKFVYNPEANATFAIMSDGRTGPAVELGYSHSHLSPQENSCESHSHLDKESAENFGSHLSGNGKAEHVPAGYTGDSDFDEILSKCRDVLVSKGKDYTIGSQDRLHNFRTAAEFMGTTPEMALGVYLYKHMASVFSYIKNGQVESEPIEGRIVDVINYMLLLYKMTKEGK